MTGFELGPWRVDHIEEMRGPVRPPAAMFQAFRPALRDANDWLLIDHIDPVSGDYIASIGGWLLRGLGRVILLDTGAGRGKPRPSHPRYDRRDSPFMRRLEALGVLPGLVDTVVISHCHVDHVGGCTLAAAGGWRPAFPTARHIIGRVELDDAQAKSAAPRPADDADLIFADSVAPLQQAGLLDAVVLPTSIAPGLTLEAAPGHTIGHAMLRLTAPGVEALFTFDVAHSALQILEPDWNTPFCEHPTLARETRRRVLAEAAQRGLLLFPTHFGHAGPCVVREAGHGYQPRFLHAVAGVVS